MANKEPVQDPPIEKQPDNRHRPQVQQKIAVSDARERANQHVLRVAGNGRHAADVRRGRDRQQVRKRRQPHTLGNGKNERHHDQAHDVVNEECRQNPAGEDHRRQQVSGLQPPQHQLRIPLEEARKVEAPHDQHHGEKQDQSGKVDVVERVAGLHDARPHHGYAADHGCPRPVDLQPGELTQRKDQVAGKKDNVRCHHAGVRHWGRR